MKKILLFTITSTIIPYLVGMGIDAAFSLIEPENIIVDSICYWLIGILVTVAIAVFALIIIKI